MYNYVSKRVVSPARKVCTAMLGKTREHLADDGLRARIEAVGSASVNLVTRNGDEPFDLDFDILIFPEESGYQGLKDRVMTAIRTEAATYGFKKIQDSTSAITCVHKKEGETDFHLDIGIVVMQNKNSGSRLIHDKINNVY